MRNEADKRDGRPDVAIPYYHVCGRCNAKWFYSQSIAGCPRCNKHSGSHEQLMPPWQANRRSEIAEKGDGDAATTRSG